MFNAIRGVFITLITVFLAIFYLPNNTEKLNALTTNYTLFIIIIAIIIEFVVPKEDK